MEIDWEQVKKKTLWHYEDLIKKMLDVPNYGFVQGHYNHTMPEALTYAEKVREGYLQNGRNATFIDEIIPHFQTLAALGIKDYLDLLHRVETKTQCEAFLTETGFPFVDLIEVLNYLFRWALPFKCPVKELVDTIAEADKTHLDALKQQKIRSNLDVLKALRTQSGRAYFASETGLSERFLLQLVHRADLSRIAYVRGKTIRHLCGGGYATLDKLATANLPQMEADMTTYYETIGKQFSDFKAVIPLDWMIGGANVLPRVVET